jgi:chemotaxis protein CheX
MIRRSALEVFSTMLGAVVQAQDVHSAAAPAADPEAGVVSFIGLAGPWAGTGSILCSPLLACRVCSQMLMTEKSSVDEEVLDAIGELTNMIVGGVKTELERHLGPLGLSIPTVIFGRNFKTKNVGTAEWTVEWFRWDDEQFEVRVCLAPNQRHSATPLRSHVCPMEVRPSPADLSS